MAQLWQLVPSLTKNIGSAGAEQISVGYVFGYVFVGYVYFNTSNMIRNILPRHLHLLIAENMRTFSLWFEMKDMT